MDEKLESNLAKCKNCGGNLKFCPASQDLFCESCKSHYPIKTDNKIEYHDLNSTNDNHSKQYLEFVNQNKSFKCSNCGASVVLNKFEIAKNCPYCNTALVVDDKAKIGLRPDAVIPFAFDEETAGEKFASAVKKRFFAPRKFKKALPQKQIKGIYIPAFNFDCDTVSEYSGQLYNEREYKDSEGRSHTERIYFHISGTWKYSYKDITVESSSKITQNELHGFLPYQFSNKKPYNNAFILGYSVEQYDKQVFECKQTYKDLLNQKIKYDILKKYHYDGVSYINIFTDFSNEKYQYHILPVYRFDYKYKNRDYVTYMNGQTGVVDKNIPKSGFKIALAILIPVLVIIGIMLITMLSK